VSYCGDLDTIPQCLDAPNVEKLRTLKHQGTVMIPARRLDVQPNLDDSRSEGWALQTAGAASVNHPG
jgi:hypothetical protein